MWFLLGFYLVSFTKVWIGGYVGSPPPCVPDAPSQRQNAISTSPFLLQGANPDCSGFIYSWKLSSSDTLAHFGIFSRFPTSVNLTWLQAFPETKLKHKNLTCAYSHYMIIIMWWLECLVFSSLSENTHCKMMYSMAGVIYPHYLLRDDEWLCYLAPIKIQHFLNIFFTFPVLSFCIKIPHFLKIL